MTLKVSSDECVRIDAVGDLVLSHNYSNIINKEHVFSKIKSFFCGADIVFGNLESVLTHEKQIRNDKVILKGMPEYIPILKNTGFNLLSVGNNHSYDFGHTGFLLLKEKTNTAAIHVGDVSIR